jgi:hypothetical protein
MADLLFITLNNGISADEQLWMDYYLSHPSVDSVTNIGGGNWTSADEVGKDAVIVLKDAIAFGSHADPLGVTLPIVCHSPIRAIDLNLSPSDFNSTADAIDILLPANDLAAGKVGTVTIFNPGFTALRCMEPAFGAGVAVVADSAVDTGKAAIFSYGVGAALVGGGLASGLRIFFTGSVTPDNFTADGQDLLNATIDAAVAGALIPGFTGTLISWDTNQPVANEATAKYSISSTFGGAEVASGNFTTDANGDYTIQEVGLTIGTEYYVAKENTTGTIQSMRKQTTVGT